MQILEVELELTGFVDVSSLAWTESTIANSNSNTPPAPLAYGGFGHLQSLGDAAVVLTVGTAQNDTGAIAQHSRQPAAPRKELKLRTLSVCQQRFDFRSAPSHPGISDPKIPH